MIPPSLLSLLSLASLVALSSDPVSATPSSSTSPAHLRRRHHAKLAAKRAANLVKKQSPIFSGAGQATLYFDINGGGTCGAVNGWDSFAETNGYAACEPNSGYKTLAQRGSNRVVAIPSQMLAGNKEKYCGKEIIATYKGKTIPDLIMWDACAACDGNGGLDFSSTIFGELVGTENCGAGRLDGLTWEITNKQIWSAETGDPVASGGSSDQGSDGDDYTPITSVTAGSSSSSATETSSSWTPPSSSSEEWTPSSSSSEEWTSSSSSSYWSSSSSWTPSSSSTEPTSSVSRPDLNVNNAKGVYSATSDKKQLAADVASSSSSSSSEEVAPSTSSAEEVASSSAEEVQPTVSASTAQSEATPITVPTEATTGETCNDRPGQWKCVGNTLEQCVQTPGDWAWLTRAWCKSVINCDSPNPVCIN